MSDVLKIAGRTISVAAMLDYDQQIEPIGGSETRRKANGAAFKMSRWTKHRISLSGAGWIPAPLVGINYAASFELELAKPEAFAVGESLPAGWSVVSESTVTDAAGNSARLVYPKMTVVSDGARLTNNNAASPSWELVCEVV